MGCDKVGVATTINKTQFGTIKIFNTKGGIFSMIKVPQGLIAILAVFVIQGCSSLTTERSVVVDDGSHYDKTRLLYRSMVDKDKPEIAKLNLFFTQMPKGGDIHHHYSGTVYAESYLEWVGLKGWYINQCSLKVEQSKSSNTACPSLTVSQVYKDDTTYRKLLTLWSDKDYSNHFHEQPAPDTNFFNTFDYFGDIAHEYTGLGLKIIKERAIKENVSYIETMLSTVGVNSQDYFSAATVKQLNLALSAASTDQELYVLFDSIVNTLTSNPKFSTELQSFLNSVDTYHQEIDDDQFLMRYQTYGVRVLPPLQVFTDLFSGYLAAEKSPLVVGVNIVAPENNVVSLKDYTLHMKMYQYLRAKHPSVNRALHAGELTLGMVRPKDLNFHIDQALNIAGAQRIGHGVDIPYESGSVELLQQLKDQAAIEINLTSNEFILGVEKQEHPYIIYSNFGVPLVIATDDSGVSRNNLSNEYMLLASRYRPTYDMIKSYAYNSIKYSFMDKPSKDLIIDNLNKRFLAFEQEMATLYDTFTLGER